MDTAFSFVVDVGEEEEENLTPGVVVAVKAVVTVTVPAVLSAARRSVDSVGSFMVVMEVEEEKCLFVVMSYGFQVEEHENGDQ